jgi:hypothetical protein
VLTLALFIAGGVFQATSSSSDAGRTDDPLTAFSPLSDACVITSVVHTSVTKREQHQSDGGTPIEVEFCEDTVVYTFSHGGSEYRERALVSRRNQRGKGLIASDRCQGSDPYDKDVLCTTECAVGAVLACWKPTEICTPTANCALDTSLSWANCGPSNTACLKLVNPQAEYDADVEAARYQGIVGIFMMATGGVTLLITLCIVGKGISDHKKNQNQKVHETEQI